MRFDIFLSSLLFGITLLTCSLAIMHMACDGLLRARQFPPPVRRRIRTLLLGTTISVSLLLFLVRLSADLSTPVAQAVRAGNPGKDLLGMGLFAAGDFYPRRVARIEGRPDSEGAHPSESRGEFRADGSWTLFSKPTRELLAGKLQSSNFGSYSGQALVWDGGKRGTLCDSWIGRVQSLGIETRDVPIIREIPDDALVIACSAGTGNSLAWEKVRAHVFKGGSALIVGRPAEGALETVQTMTRAHSFRASPEGEPLRIVAGGPSVSWGGFPAGLRLYFGGSAGSHAELALADVSGERGELVALRGSSDDAGALTSLTAMINTGYGKGRVSWVGIPPKLFGKAELMSGAAWELMSQRLVASLLRIPQAGLESWPDASPAPVVLAIHVDHDLDQALNVSKLLHARKIPSTSYLIMSEAKAHTSSFAKLLASNSMAGDELGIADLDHSSVAGLDFYERFDRIKQWTRAFGDFPRPTELEPSGEIMLAGATDVADQYAALIANRLKYAVMDPYGDQGSPYRIHLARTTELIQALGNGRSLGDVAGAGSLIVWPSRFLDDWAMAHEAGGFQDLPELRRILADEYRNSCWTGAPLLFRVSTAGLAGSDYANATLGPLLDGLKKQGATFARAAELMQFWETRSDISVSMEATDPSRVPPEALREAEADPAGDDVAVTGDSDSENDEPAKPQHRVGKEPDKQVYRVTVTNGSSHALEHSVLRITEPERFSLLAERPPESKRSPASGAHGRLSVARVALPRIEPGESYVIWMVERDDLDGEAGSDLAQSAVDSGR